MGPKSVIVRGTEGRGADVGSGTGEGGLVEEWATLSLLETASETGCSNSPPSLLSLSALS
jgi:hypothetical protein